MKTFYHPQRSRQKHGKVERALQQAIIAMLQVEPREYKDIQALARMAQQAQANRK